MKKIITVAAVIVTLCYNLQGQTVVSPTATVAESFINEFKGATDVEWQKVSKDIVLVRFNRNDDHLLAYFDQSGTLLKSGQKIQFERTPLLIQTSLDNVKRTYEKKNGQLSITHIYQLIENGQVSYFTNMGNENLYLAILTKSNGNNTILRNVKLNLRKADQQPTIVSKD